MNLNIRETLTKYKRVLLIARKPDTDELKETARICGIGSILIGIIGFIFYLISVVFGGV